MYKPGGVLDFLNKDNYGDLEDTEISSLFKEETELSQIFHHNKSVKTQQSNDEDDHFNNSLLTSSLLHEETLTVSPKKSTDIGRRAEAKRKKKALKERQVQDVRTLFVGNVPLSTTKKELLGIFKKCGQIESIRFRSIPAGDIKLPKKAVAIKEAFHPRGKSMNAYVVFEQAEMVQEALLLNNTALHGFHLRLDAASQGKQVSHDKSIFVGNVPFNCEEESLRERFEECGEVEAVRMIRDRNTAVGKGFAYVTFKDESSVALALKMDGCELGRRKLRVQRSVSKPKVAKMEVRRVRGEDSKVNKKFDAKRNAKGNWKNKIKKDQTAGKRPAGLPSKKMSKEKEVGGGMKKKIKKVFSKTQKNLSEKKAEGVGKRKKLKKVIKQKALKRKQTRIGQIFSKQ